MHFQHKHEGSVKQAKLCYGEYELIDVPLVEGITVDQYNAYGSPTYYTGAPDPVVRVSLGTAIAVLTHMTEDDWEALNQYKTDHGDWHIQKIVIKPWCGPKIELPVDRVVNVEDLEVLERENASGLVHIQLTFEVRSSKLPISWQ